MNKELIHENVKIEIMRIHPDMAAEILEKNINNRNLNFKRVNFFYNLFKSGDFIFNGDPIRISDDGNLIDGQHRLNGLIMANKTFDFLVIKGLKQNVILTIDMSANRHFSDILKIKGYTYISAISSLTSALYKIKNNEALNHKYFVRTKLNLIKLDRFFELNSVFIEKCVKKSDSYRNYIKKHKGLKYMPSVFMVFHAFNTLNGNDCEDFFQRFFLGITNDNKDPVINLRNIFIDSLIENKKYFIKFEPQLHLLLSALFNPNKYKHNKYITMQMIINEFPLFFNTEKLNNTNI